MSLESRVTDVVTRIGQEFKSIRTALADKATIDHTHHGSDITSEVPRTRLPGATISATGLAQYATDVQAVAQRVTNRAVTPSNLKAVIGTNISIGNFLGQPDNTPISTTWTTLTNGNNTGNTIKGAGFTRSNSGPSTGVVTVNEAGMLIALMRFVPQTVSANGVDMRLSISGVSDDAISGSSQGTGSWHTVCLIGSAYVAAGATLSPMLRRVGGTDWTLYGPSTSMTYILIPC